MITVEKARTIKSDFQHHHWQNLIGNVHLPHPSAIFVFIV